MSKVRTVERGINRDIHSKALLADPKSPAYRAYLEKKTIHERMLRLEAIVETLAQKLESK